MKHIIAFALFSFCISASHFAAESQDTAKAYCGSSQSDKYHKPNCQWAKKVLPSNLIWFSSKEDAKKKNYKPCGVCKP